MRSLWAAGLLLRRLRAELRMITLLFLVIAATSFLFAAAPRLFNRASDEAVRYAARAASSVQRNVVLSEAARLSPGRDGGVSEVRARGDQLAEQLPASLAALIAERSLRVTSVRFATADPNFSYLSLQYQDGLAAATTLVAGRWPVDRGVPVPLVTMVNRPGAAGGGDQAPPVVLEVALSSAEAFEMGLELGDRVALALDGTEPMLSGTPLQVAPLEIEVVGLFDPIDPTAEYWSDDRSLLHVVQVGTFFDPVFQAAAYIPADMYPDLWASGLPFHYEWWFQVDPQRLDGGKVEQLRTDLRHLDSIAAFSAIAAPGTVQLRTGLPGILDAYAEQLARSESILSVAAIGPFGLAGGVLAMLAILLAARRRAALALARGRGASGALVLGTELWEAILIAGGASLLGLLGAVVAIPARASSLSPILAAAVGGGAILLLLGSTWPMARRQLGQLERDDPPGLRVAPRRLVLELTIVAIAGAGALLLRERGLTVADGATATFNPLLATAPVLCGLAAGIVALRLYPLPVRALGWLAARRRDLVPVLGLRMIGRHPAAANLALLVLMLTAAFGAFSSVIVSSIDRGQVAASYLTVGADYRIERAAIGALAPSLDPSSIAGIDAVAPGIVDSRAAFADTDVQRATIHLEAVDPLAYEAVALGSAADPSWPDALVADPAGAAIGTTQNPIPAILSQRLPAGSAGLAPGDTFRITVVGQELTFRLVEQRASFPGIADSTPFAVVPFNWIQAALGRPQPPTVMWLRGSADAAQPLAEAIAAVGGSTRIISRYHVYGALHDAPLGAAVATGYALALIVAAMYMALAIIGTVVLSAARRTQDLAYLRTLGVTARQALALTFVEHAPPVLLALVPGVALGIGVAFLLEPGLGFAAFVGTSGLPLVVDWVALLLMLAALIGVVVAAVTAGTWLSRRARLVDALRIGED